MNLDDLFPPGQCDDDRADYLYGLRPAYTFDEHYEQAMRSVERVMEAEGEIG